jgi:tetratricopeptide (TPR) repeat protein
MAVEGSSGQRAKGSYIAQAEGGSTATVNVFQMAPPASVDADDLAEAEALLAGMPLDAVPEPSGLPAGSRMPWRRNALFVGREADLATLAAALKAGGTAAVGQSAAVTGLGGIGKTQLASEFAYRYGRYFAGGVFWLSFADPASIASEIAACGGPRALNLQPGFDELPLNDQAGLVASAWHSDLPRLLVFDNCEDETLLQTWSPRAGGCRVLVTSRRSEWRPELGVAAVALGVMDRRESVSLLCKHRPDLSEDDPELDAVADELGDLPLALHLAGSFLARYRQAALGTPSHYLAEVRRPDLLAHRSMTIGGRSPTGHEQDVARSFALSYGQLDPEAPDDAMALATLSRAAWFAPGEPIPRDLVRLSAGVEEDDDDGLMGFEDGLSRLKGLGLLGEEEDGSLVVHRLLGAFVRSEAEDGQAARNAVERTVLAEAQRLNQAGLPAPLSAWLPHLRVVAELADETKSVNAGDLLNNLGLHLHIVADYAGAQTALERALAIAEAAFGPDHPNVGAVNSNLGLVLKDRSDLTGAKAAFARALAISEETLGPNHPKVGLVINNLGLVLKDLGDLAGARAAYERALAISEAALGPGQAEVATVLNNLGLVLRDLGDLDSAKAKLERALAIDKATLRPDDPKVANTLNNLGLVLWDQGDLDGARAAHESALAIAESAFGPDHPEVATDVNNLGRVLQALGDLANAQAAFERALEIDEAAFGPVHPNVARDVNNLGSILNDMEDPAGAEAAYERALAINEEALGPDHFEVATNLNNLGVVRLAFGNLTGAQAAYERSLAIMEAALGTDHPKVATTLSNLGEVLRNLGDLAGAKVSQERALAIHKAAFGPDHPQVGVILNNLGLVLRALGDLAGARTALKRALAINEAIFGPDHPNTVTCRKNLERLK